jgi:hypothetical protein
MCASSSLQHHGKGGARSLIASATVNELSDSQTLRNVALGSMAARI